MRENFITTHRGGPLERADHQRLMLWACECSEHVLPLFSGVPDERLTRALAIARRWASGEAATGEAMKAAYVAHAAAREIPDPVSKAIARSIGQAVSTAHMADHSPGAAWYALRAVKQAGLPVGSEKEWQLSRMSGWPVQLRQIVLTFWVQKKLDKTL